MIPIIADRMGLVYLSGGIALASLLVFWMALPSRKAPALDTSMDFATTLVDPAEGGPSAPFPSVFTLPARVVHAPGTPAPVSEVGDAAESSATAAPAPSARARRGLRTGVIPPFTHTTTDRLVDLSIVVPAYNEQGRLPAMMEQTLRHLLLAAGEDPVEGASAEELRAAHDTRRALANATAFLQGVPYFVEAGPAGPSPRCTPPPAHVTVFNRRAAAEPTAQPGRRTKPIYRHARAADASTAAEADLAVSDLHLTMPNSHGTHVFSFEVVIVDDGSADATAHVARSLTSVYTADRVRLLRLPRNVGKGGAVAAGVLRSRGRLILFADADGATDLPTALPRMVDACVEQLRAAEDPGHGMALAVGSRAASGSGDARVERAPVRAFLQHAFQASLAAIGGVGGVADTQCGFKLATRPAARLLYPQLHLEGWLFDVELLHLASRLQIPVVEVPVSWQEIPGSKVQLLRASVSMARDLLTMRLAYVLGVWKASSSL